MSQKSPSLQSPEKFLDLRKSGVYAIRNKIDEKMYIGSASSTFQGRLSVHRNGLKRGKHHSQYLTRAIQKHGIENFEFIIIHFCEPEECIEWEQIFIDQYKPEYNICPTAGSVRGIKRSQETKDKCREIKIQSIYSIQTPEKIIVEVDNLSEFCKQNKFSQKGLMETLTQTSQDGYEYLQYKGYAILHRRNIGEPAPENLELREFPEKGSQEWIDSRQKAHEKFEYEIQLPTNEIVKTRSLTKFCKERDLYDGTLQSTLYGVTAKGIKCNRYKDYVILSKTPIDPETGQLLEDQVQRRETILANGPITLEYRKQLMDAHRQPLKEPKAITNEPTVRGQKYLYTIETPTKETIHTTNLFQFAKDNNLTYKVLNDTLRGKDASGKTVTTCKGFVVLSRQSLTDSATIEIRAQIPTKVAELSSESRQAMRDAKAKYVYVIQLPDGTTQETTSLNEFCTLHGLTYSLLSLTLPGQKTSRGHTMTHTKGYKLLSKSPIAKAAIDA